MFEIQIHALNVDGSTVNRSSKSSSFSDAISIYMHAVEFTKGEILWGPDAVEARVHFVSNGRTTEITTLRHGLSGEFEVSARTI
jgi:hypothetical protein